MIGSINLGYSTQDKNSPLALGHLDEIGVEVEDLNPDIDPDGVFKEQTQKYVEFKLKMARINVSNKERNKVKGNPCLYVLINILKFQKRYFYSATISLQEDVNLIRDRKRKIFGATTWSTRSIGVIKNLDGLREIVKEGVEEFINAYFSINPQ